MALVAPTFPGLSYLYPGPSPGRPGIRNVTAPGGLVVCGGSAVKSRRSRRSAPAPVVAALGDHGPPAADPHRGRGLGLRRQQARRRGHHQVGGPGGRRRLRHQHVPMQGGHGRGRPGRRRSAFSNAVMRVGPDDDPRAIVGAYAEVNNFGTTRVLRAFAPLLRDNGRLIVVASSLGTLRYVAPVLHDRFDGLPSLDEVDTQVVAGRGQGRQRLARLRQHPLQDRPGSRCPRPRRTAPRAGPHERHLARRGLPGHDEHAYLGHVVGRQRRPQPRRGRSRPAGPRLRRRQRRPLRPARPQRKRPALGSGAVVTRHPPGHRTRARCGRTGRGSRQLPRRPPGVGSDGGSGDERARAPDHWS